jgi:hypothetical protein
MIIQVEEGPYWDRLLKDSAKQHWLKIDFSKWKDEDDSEGEGEGGAPGQVKDVGVHKRYLMII